MDWKMELVDRLKNHRYQKCAQDTLPVLIQQEKDHVEEIRRFLDGADPKRQTGKSLEYQLMSCLALIRELKRNLSRASESVWEMEAGLSTLSETDRMILDSFYIYPAKGCVDRLCDSLCYGKSTIYRLRDIALARLAVELYGIGDSLKQRDLEPLIRMDDQEEAATE